MNHSLGIVQAVTRAENNGLVWFVCLDTSLEKISAVRGNLMRESGVEDWVASYRFRRSIRRFDYSPALFDHGYVASFGGVEL